MTRIKESAGSGGNGGARKAGIRRSIAGVRMSGKCKPTWMLSDVRKPVGKAG